MQKPTQNPLQTLIGHVVKVISPDQRVFVGILKGIDQTMNCILNQAQQHIYEDQNQQMKSNFIGTYLIRGDNVAVIGKYIDQENDSDQQDEESNQPKKQ